MCQRPYLDKHVKVVHKKMKDYLCSECEKVFSQKTSLGRCTKNIHLQGMFFSISLDIRLVKHAKIGGSDSSGVISFQFLRRERVSIAGCHSGKWKGQLKDYRREELMKIGNIWPLFIKHGISFQHGEILTKVYHPQF